MTARKRREIADLVHAIFPPDFGAGNDRRHAYEPSCRGVEVKGNALVWGCGDGEWSTSC